MADDPEARGILGNLIATSQQLQYASGDLESMLKAVKQVKRAARGAEWRLRMLRRRRKSAAAAGGQPAAEPPEKPRKRPMKKLW